jgi:hypothetical protein
MWITNHRGMTLEQVLIMAQMNVIFAGAPDRVSKVSPEREPREALCA